jgi:hypothetical protein
MPRIATTGITSWQNALKWTADCQVGAQVAKVKSSLWHSALKFTPLVCGNPHDGYSILGNPRSKRFGLPQSAAHI